jgi:dienelactone hydrolase
VGIHLTPVKDPLGIHSPHPGQARVRGASSAIAGPIHQRAIRIALLIFAALILPLSPSSVESQGASEQVITVPTRPSITETAGVGRPSMKPVATLVVLVGGSGKLDLTPRGLPRDASGPLIKRREQLAGQGFVVAFVDAPSGRPGEGLIAFRTSREHSVDIGAVIAWLRHDDPVPLWLVGSSMGTVSAASAAARLGKDGPDGLVLISSVTRTHPAMRESLADVPLESIQAPTLLIHHRQDPCEITRYDDASVLPRRLPNAKRVELVTVEGGPSARGLPCGPESPHAFFGTEDVLIDRVASWIKRTPVR